jgi:23S rRNA (pseudouridine1915-N3)-methyltransferase
MRLVIAAVGKLKAGPERLLIERYLERANAAGRAVSMAPVDVIEIPESSARNPAQGQKEESEKLLKVLPKDARRIVLDSHGQPLTSEQFATALARFRDAGNQACALLIGGADGFDQSLVKGAHLTFSFGAATFPHQIVRILLAEQIYRAITILSGHPYHRA